MSAKIIGQLLECNAARGQLPAIGSLAGNALSKQVLSSVNLPNHHLTSQQSSWRSWWRWSSPSGQQGGKQTGGQMQQVGNNG